jgi:hypothetical protein
MRLFIVFYTVFFLLTACATTEGYQRQVNKWQGKNIQTLIDNWGQPDAEIPLKNGNKVYQYTRKTLYSIPDPKRTPIVNESKTLFSGYGESWSNGQAMSRYCQTSFETTPDGHIVHISFKGDNCISNNIFH